MDAHEFKSAVEPGSSPSNFSDLVEKAKRWADPKNPLPPVEPNTPTSPMDVISSRLKPLGSLESPELTLRKHPELLFLDSSERRPAADLIAQLATCANMPHGVVKRLLPETEFAEFASDSIADAKVPDADPAEYIAKLIGWKYSTAIKESDPLYKKMVTLGIIPPK